MSVFTQKLSKFFLLVKHMGMKGHFSTIVSSHPGRNK